MRINHKLFQILFKLEIHFNIKKKVENGRNGVNVSKNEA